jgi:hypothetical protein
MTMIGYARVSTVKADRPQLRQADEGIAAG